MQLVKRPCNPLGKPSVLRRGRLRNVDVSLSTRFFRRLFYARPLRSRACRRHSLFCMHAAAPTRHLTPRPPLPFFFLPSVLDCHRPFSNPMPTEFDVLQYSMRIYIFVHHVQYRLTFPLFLFRFSHGGSQASLIGYPRGKPPCAWTTMGSG